ncbi:class I SAM-dependent methyltransferase [Leptospira interrogans]|uniref:class I SAM-dependent methyltransferase n=1 Tax=Leptospira interrogans TaxID=173 RepID=UPI00193C5193|nr:class I SAM-dependent methyltransferase [Leptospira interrogans]MBM2890342.1 class I SAM-dependent methyltransferase [Leptospira interrogans]
MNRKSEISIRRGHPWIFGGNLSSATSHFVNGQWLNLVSTTNVPLATGIYSTTGLIRIRVIQFLPSFSKEKMRENLIYALKKRNELRKITNAYRILHGENDFFPGITIDRLNTTWVVRIYSSSLLVYGRWLVWNLFDICKNSKLGEPQPKRILFDPPEKTGEDKIGFKKKDPADHSQTFTPSKLDKSNFNQNLTSEKSNFKKISSSETLEKEILDNFNLENDLSTFSQNTNLSDNDSKEILKYPKQNSNLSNSDPFKTSQENIFYNSILKKQNLESTINLIHERLWRGNRQSTRNRSNFTKEKTKHFIQKEIYHSDKYKIRETIRLYEVNFPIELPGQKGGIFLDLRNLRRFLLEKKELSKNKNCLHLFSHTGLTSICMEIAGASSVISVDGSKEALDSFQRVLSLNKNKGNCKHRFLRKNIFKELEEILQNKSFGLIVIDPPNLTPDAKSKSNALKSYSYLFANSLSSLEESGTIILCSCSGRIKTQELESLAKNILQSKGWKFERFTSLKPEVDHPIRKNFPEGNYFKVHIYENCKKN